jgi:hypothetical protein
VRRCVARPQRTRRATWQGLSPRAATESARSYDELAGDPLAAWIETRFGLDRDESSQRLIRSKPTTVPAAAGELAELTHEQPDTCAVALERLLQAGSRAKDSRTGRPLFAFRLHQFLSKGDIPSRPRTGAKWTTTDMADLMNRVLTYLR